LAPFDRPAVYNWYQCLRRLGRDTEARRCGAQLDRLDADLKLLDEVTRALLQSPNDLGLRCEAGAILLRNGEAEKGLAWLGMVLQPEPRHPVAHQALADYWERQGDSGRAAVHQRMAGAVRSPQP